MEASSRAKQLASGAESERRKQRDGPGGRGLGRGSTTEPNNAQTTRALCHMTFHLMGAYTAYVFSPVGGRQRSCLLWVGSLPVPLYGVSGAAQSTLQDFEGASGAVEGCMLSKAPTF